MTKWALLQDDIVVAITPDLLTEPSAPAGYSYAQAPDGLVEGQRRNADTTWTAAPPPPPPSTTVLLLYATNKQAAWASAGFAYNLSAAGQSAQIIEADTSVEGRLNLSGLVQLAQINSSFTTVWVQSTGNITLTASQIIALGVAVGEFIEKTYQALASVLSEIESGAISTFAGVDAAAWPLQSA